MLNSRSYRKCNNPRIRKAVGLTYRRRRPRQYPGNSTLIAKLQALISIYNVTEQCISSATAEYADLPTERGIESALDWLRLPYGATEFDN